MLVIVFTEKYLLDLMIQKLENRTKSLVLPKKNCGNVYLSLLQLRHFPILTKIELLLLRESNPLLKVAFAITFHNSQGTTLEYTEIDFNRTSKTGKVDSVPVNEGALYVPLDKKS